MPNDTCRPLSGRRPAFRGLQNAYQIVAHVAINLQQTTALFPKWKILRRYVHGHRAAPAPDPADAAAGLGR